MADLLPEEQLDMEMELTPQASLRRDIEIMERQNKQSESYLNVLKQLDVLVKRLNDLQRVVADMAVHLGIAEHKKKSIN